MGRTCKRQACGCSLSLHSVSICWTSVFSRSGGGEDAAVGSCWFSLRAEDEAEEDDGAMMGGVVDVGEGLGNWGFKISRAVETGGFRRRS